MKLEGITRHAGVHAAAVVIADAPLTNYVPLRGEKDGTVTTQYSMDYVVDVGLVKMDFLGLKTLTIISQHRPRRPTRAGHHRGHAPHPHGRHQDLTELLCRPTPAPFSSSKARA